MYGGIRVLPTLPSVKNDDNDDLDADENVAEPASSMKKVKLGKKIETGRFTNSARLTSSFSTESQFSRKGKSRPSCVQMAPNGDFIIVDCADKLVRAFNRMGQARLEIGQGCLKKPWNVTVIDNNYYAVSDPGANSIKIFDVRQPQKIVRTIDFGPTILEPFGLCMNKSHTDLIVTDKGTGRIYIFDKDGPVKTSVEPRSRLTWPQYVALGDEESVLVTDYVDHKVYEYDMKGNEIFAYGSQGSSDEEFLGPQGLTVDKHGYIFIADSANNRIHALDKNGNFIKHVVTEKDKLDRPQSLTIDRDGYLVIAEYGGFIKLFEYLN
ncbi:DgyrCDS7345 [Dimorphilus gyrociliatus]|uniref:DgyrCDS7345 n=1 Tax=Dimorphilus gyrociliatus TaxID=2664684 RepID=A0A7I8VQZ1_9ANNE|nr:DgyrCDS7345 [Dimorphilus gyrociliatus]